MHAFWSSGSCARFSCRYLILCVCRMASKSYLSGGFRRVRNHGSFCLRITLRHSPHPCWAQVGYSGGSAAKPNFSDAAQEYRSRREAPDAHGRERAMARQHRADTLLDLVSWARSNSIIDTTVLNRASRWKMPPVLGRWAPLPSVHVTYGSQREGLV